MSAYAVGVFHDIQRVPEIVEYLERIDDTLRPFGGRFLVHGAPPEVVEGTWTDTLVVIEFPDMDKARAWYESPGYQAIVPLRTRNSKGAAFLVQGVGENYKATDAMKTWT
ncbi:DUF1330 domain-containing protein [Thermomonospora amylolytica]|uniref:DUF1330 domain-containing protein n=1 Tax=Thermomonospora amylolytica TaxID=1411117 RepID=UPI000E6D19BB|nr:DUF1330 domain-containing protein [Thermomonospora amylolytica]